MTLADLTTEDINAAINRSLVTVEGQTYDEWARPYAWTLKPFAEPPVVVYTAIDGKTYSRTFEIEIEGDAINAVLGSDRQRVEARTVWTPVEFALANFTEDGEWIEREGKVFECGDYVLPIGPFTLTTEHADTAIAAGKSVPNDLEHVPTVLTQDEDGNRRTDILGETVLTRREGNAVFGKVRIPKWLHEKHGDAALKVSATWHPSQKTLEGMALCLKPRITDAAVFATFAASADFQTFKAEHPSEAEKIATAATLAPSPAPPMLTPQQIQDAAWKSFSADPQNAGVKQEDFLAAFATKAEEKPVVTIVKDPEQEARIKALEEKQEASFKADAERQDASDATSFYEELLKDGKAGPAKRKEVEFSFTLARSNDRKAMATFSANAEGSAEAQLRSIWKEKPAEFRIGAGLLDSSAPIPSSVNPFHREPKKENA